MRVFIFILVLCLPTAALKSQVFEWVGTTDTLFSEGTNWLGGVAPSSNSDTIIFNSGSNNCFLDMGVAASVFSISSGYSGLINCDIVDVSIDGDFVMDGGVFLNTMDLSTGLRVSGNFIQTGGTFIDHGGKLAIYMTQNQTYSLSATNLSVSLVYLDSPTGSSTTRTISLSGITTNTLAQNNAGSLAFQGSIDVTSTFSLNSGRVSSVTPVGNTGTINFVGAGPILVKGVSLSKRFFGMLPSITINTSGSITFSNCLNIDGNWTHNAGQITATSASSIYFSGTTSTISGTAINGTDLNFNNLIITGTGNVTLPTTNSLVVASTYSVDGTTTNGAQAGVVFIGPNSEISGTSTVSLNEVTVINSNTLTLNTPLSIYEEVDIQGVSELNTGGYLTLESTATQKSRIDSLNGGTLNGNVKVNSYIPGPTSGWVLLGPPVNNMTVIDLENSFFITCIGCTYDPTVVPGDFYSVQGWDGDDFITTGITSATPLTPGQSLWLFVGDGPTTTSDFTFYSNLNTPIIGNYTVNIAAGTGGGPYSTQYFGLAANPYPSPLDHDLFAFANSSVLQSLNVSVYDADANGGTGGWITVPFGSNAKFPIAQGMCVEFMNGGSQPLVFDETMKATSANSVTKSVPKIPQFALQLSGAPGYKNKTHFMLSNMGSFQADKLDLHKVKSNINKSTPPPAHHSEINSLWLGEEMAVLSLPVLSSSVAIPLVCKFNSVGTYTINVTDLKVYSGCVILHDKKTNAFTNLLLKNYVFYIQDINDTNRFELLLFEDENAHSTSISTPDVTSLTKIASTSDGVYLFTQYPNATQVEIEVYNLVGQKIMDTFRFQSEQGATKLPIETNEKIIIVKVTANNEVVTKKIIINN